MGAPKSKMPCICSRRPQARRRVPPSARTGRYNTRDFVESAQASGSAQHLSEIAKGSAVDGSTTRHAGCTISQRTRKKSEEVFGWVIIVAGPRKVKHRGRARVDWIVTIACTAYNLVFLRRLPPSLTLGRR